MAVGVGGVLGLFPSEKLGLSWADAGLTRKGRGIVLGTRALREVRPPVG